MENIDAVKHPNIIIPIDLYISSNSFPPPVAEANGRLGFLNATEADSLPLHVLSACPSTQGKKDRNKLAIAMQLLAEFRLRL